MRSFVPTRRDLVLAVAAATAVPAVGRAQVQSVPTWRTEVRQVAPNVYAFIRGGGPGIDNASLSNAGIIVGPDSVTLVDALGPPIHAKELRAAVRQITTKPVARIINTHHHRDHTNGDYLFQPAEIVMTPAMRDLLVKQGIPAHPYPDRPQWQAGMSELKLALPTTLITSDVTYLYGDLVVQVIVPGSAHTFGDLMVYLPQRRLLFAGDIASFYVTPGLHNGDADHWLAVCDRIQKMDVDVIVPGHGPIGGKKELADVADYIALMKREIRKGYDAKKTPGRAAADADVGRFAQWDNQDRWAWAAVRLYDQWNGVMRPEQDVAGQQKAVAEYQAILAARKAGAR